MTEPLAKALDRDCIGIHLPTPTEGHTRIDWAPMRSGSERVRVQDYTCDCRLTFYELCQVGGQLFIRRTRRLREHQVVDESPRASMTKAIALWTRLLSGSVV